ncbi:unnamed protein product [Prorocentrum cordatum]|uniref:Diphthine--ammonia ligase n=1 Tax=Prorocentrum cordatum TaxID=2364126 RepID=A0ABN9T2V5_9DINO|nr:unnamed protein product [Polarella glacialis]
MRVVGLISGGKDSIWNLHYCRHFGHEVLCVANLAPPAGVNELDSYMYQTVGSDLIDAIAASLGLPLVRRVISGEPKGISSQDYIPQEGDEVEDLTLLLQDVLREHPGMQAVSCGAILSNYQRVRVENVCARLGLKSLAFLWMQEQPRLLRQMIDGGLDARIVKVASMGLEARHVGQSILTPSFSEYLLGLGRKWGVHVCGEGGEYETMVLGAPLYGGSVRIVSSETCAHPGGDQDGVAFLRVLEVSEDPSEDPPARPPFQVLEPYSSLSYYQDTFALLRPPWPAGHPAPPHGAPPWVAGPTAGAGGAPPCLARAGHLLASSSLDVFSLGLEPQGRPDEQCDSVLGAVAAWLRDAHGRGLRDAVFVELQVADLGCFEAVNAVYARHFAEDPPPRVCVETPLPEGLHLRARLLLRGHAGPAEPGASGRVRVQSISTWAMACIGPYSQALWTGPALLSAGVLGLVPHSMALPAAEDAAAATVDAESDSVSERQRPRESATGASILQWEAELWMLARSMRNVLAEVGSGLGEVAMAQVYVSGQCDFGAVRERVLGYLRRECASADPIVTMVAVPRLPKDGSISQINVTCTPGSTAPATVQVLEARAPAGVPAPVAGAVSCVAREVAGARVSSAEFVPAEGAEAAELPPEAVRHMVERCAAATWEALGVSASSGPPAGIGLQAQLALRGPGAERAAAAALAEAAEEAGVAEVCAISLMPVLALGHGALVRLIGTSGGAASGPLGGPPDAGAAAVPTLAMARSISLRDLDGAWVGPRLDLGEASDGQHVACKVPWWVTHLLVDVAREGCDQQPAILRRWPSRPGADDAAAAGRPVHLAMGDNDVWVDLPRTGAGPGNGGEAGSLLLRAEREEPLRGWLPSARGYLLSESSVLLFMVGLCAVLCSQVSYAAAVPLLSAIPVARLCPELPLLFSPRCLRAPSWLERSRHTLVAAAWCVAAVSALLLFVCAARGDFGTPAAWWPPAPSPAGRARPAEPAWEPTLPRVDCASLAGVDCSARLAAWAGPGACAVLAQTEGTCASFCSRAGRTCLRAMDDVGTGECAVDEGGHRRQQPGEDGCLQDWHTQICVCGREPRREDTVPMQAGWSDAKKVWCCQHRGLGCPSLESDTCFELGAKYEPIDMPGQRGTHASTMHHCQQRCARSPGCARFTWFVDKQRCHLQEYSATLLPSDESVAGPADCEVEAEMRLAEAGGGGDAPRPRPSEERQRPRPAEELRPPGRPAGRPRLAGGSLLAVLAVLAAIAVVAASRAGATAKPCPSAQREEVIGHITGWPSVLACRPGQPESTREPLDSASLLLVAPGVAKVPFPFLLSLAGSPQWFGPLGRTEERFVPGGATYRLKELWQAYFDFGSLTFVVEVVEKIGAAHAHALTQGPTPRQGRAARRPSARWPPDQAEETDAMGTPSVDAALREIEASLADIQWSLAQGPTGRALRRKVVKTQSSNPPAVTVGMASEGARGPPVGATQGAPARQTLRADAALRAALEGGEAAHADGAAGGEAAPAPPRAAVPRAAAEASAQAAAGLPLGEGPGSPGAARAPAPEPPPPGAAAAGAPAPKGPRANAALRAAPASGEKAWELVPRGPVPLPVNGAVAPWFCRYLVRADRHINVTWFNVPLVARAVDSAIEYEIGCGWDVRWVNRRSADLRPRLRLLLRRSLRTSALRAALAGQQARRRATVLAGLEDAVGTSTAAAVLAAIDGAKVVTPPHAVTAAATAPDKVRSPSLQP